MNLIVTLYVITKFLFQFGVAASDEETEVIIYKAIKCGSLKNLQKVLSDYPRDINEKPFLLADGSDEIKMSPLQLAIACHNIKKIKFLIQQKHPVIDIDTFEIVFRTSCVKCFDILLNRSKELFEWNFNRELLDRIQKYSVDNEHFFLFVAKHAKRLDFNHKLALIENAFNQCTDHDQIIFAVDAVELDLIQNNTDLSLLKRYMSAIAYFSRFMVAKRDYVDLLPWATSLFEKYSPVDDSTRLFTEYTSLVQTFDDRKLIVAQPEDYLVRYKNILYKQLNNMIKGIENELVGPRVMLKLISGDTDNLRSDVRERLPEYLRQINNSFKQAITYNSVDCLNLLLEFMDIGSVNFREALELSIEKNSADCLRILNGTGLGGEYTIYSRCYHAITWNAADCLKVLLENSKDVPEQEKLLINAVKLKATECVKVLLAHGVNPDATDVANNTALKLAARSDDISCVRLFLGYGANPNIPDNYGIMPLTYAVEKKSFEITEELLKYGANPNIFNIQDQTLLSFLIEIGSAKFLKILLEYGANPNVVDNYGSIPLIEAIKRDEKECVKLLLEFKADPNMMDHSRKTPLMAAIDRDSVDYLYILIENGANLHDKSKIDHKLATYAELKRATRCIEMLLKKGLEIDQEDEKIGKKGI